MVPKCELNKGDARGRVPTDGVKRHEGGLSYRQASKAGSGRGGPPREELPSWLSVTHGQP